MANGIFVEGTVADSAELTLPAIERIPGRVAAARVHAEVPFGVPHLACDYSQSLNC